MLADKDVEGSLAKIAKEIDIWYCVSLPTARGLEVNELASVVRKVAKIDAKILVFDSVTKAYQFALQAAQQADAIESRNTRQINLLSAQKAEPLTQGNGDRVVVFGSFFTVAEVLKQLESNAFSSQEA
jgi:dihydrofolate synthase/folylpolyglutamate synthase